MGGWETFLGGAICFVIYLVISSILELLRQNFAERPKRAFIIPDRERRKYP